MFGIFSPHKGMTNRMDVMDICILLSTCDKYVHLAALTIDLLSQKWPDHPPIYVCGVSYDFTEKAEVLSLRDNPRDWIGITESAAATLLARGYRKCYLILDDHPPLADCNENHLNQTLPALMDELKAAYIGLYGWDQGTVSAGNILPSGFYRIQRQSDTFLWRFSLHPALWSIKTLQDITSSLPMLHGDISTRSIWAFERRAGDVSINDPRWKGRSFRIFGGAMLSGRFGLIRGYLRQVCFFFVNALLLIIKTIFGVSVQERLSNHTVPERLFFNGPYPLYWSGIMQKGRLNESFERYLIRHGRLEELERIRETFERMKS